ncbi:MAG: DUF1801 domain-containing protein [Planctomycetota bacterium]
MTPPKAQPVVDPRVDEYIQNAAPFAQPILTRIREAFHAGAPGCSETIKWGAPFFEQEGVLGGMSAFTKHVGFGFWRGKELEDPAGIFPKDIKASRMNIKVTDVKQLPTKKVLTDYVRRAVALNAAGKPAAKPRKAVKVPDMPPSSSVGSPRTKPPTSSGRPCRRVATRNTSSGSPKPSATPRGNSAWKPRSSGWRRASGAIGNTATAERAWRRTLKLVCHRQRAWRILRERRMPLLRPLLVSPEARAAHSQPHLIAVRRGRKSIGSGRARGPLRIAVKPARSRGHPCRVRLPRRRRGGK